MTEGAVTAFDAAVEAVHAGECIGVYPEGTITKDPDGWPMRGKTGAARIALATGCPVIPIGQWGAQDMLPAYSLRPHLFPRKTTSYKVGDPVDLSDLMGKPVTNEVLHEATDRIMAAITALVEDLRGEKAPAVRFDPRTSGVTEIGNPQEEEEGVDEQGRGVRRRLLGYGVQPRPRRRRQRRDHLGSSARGVRRDQREAREHRVLPRDRAARERLRHARPRRGREGCRVRGALGAVAEAAREPQRSGPT